MHYEAQQKVWLATKDLPESVAVKHKLAAPFMGPFVILEMINDTAARLALPADIRVHPVFHVS